MIKKEFIDKCVKFCKDKNAIVLHSCSVFKQNDKNKGQKKRVLCITNQFITYFKEQSKITPDRLHYWRKVSSFEFLDNQVLIKFLNNEKIRFVHPKIETVKPVFLELFLRTFSVEELGPLDLSRYPHPPITVNGRGILSRFDTLFSESNCESNMHARKYFEKFLTNKSKTVAFTEFHQIENDLPKILEALRPIPYVHLLSLPKLKDTENLYSALNDFVSKNSDLKMLVLHNNADMNFLTFAGALRDSAVSQLKGITFEDVQFTEEELSKVKQLSSDRQFTSIAFINSVSSNIMNHLYVDFLSNEVMNSLRFLSLDKTIGLNLTDLTKRITSLNVLSLSQCDLDIVDVFEAIGNMRLNNLRLLNLSGNKMIKIFDDTNVEFVSNLERIDVSSVSWGSGTFPSFIKTVLDQDYRNGLKFYCSAAQGISESEWSKVFDVFSSYETGPFVDFSWSFNKLSPHLFEFLARNKKLTSLFLSNCFDEQNLELVPQFCEVVHRLDSVKYFTLTGTEGFELREKVEQLFEHMKGMKSLRYLNVDGNKIKEEGVKKLNDLIANNVTLIEVSYDKSFIRSADCIKEMIKAGESRRKPLRISWPTHDFERLSKSDKVTNEELTEIKKSLTAVATGRGGARVIAIRRQSVNMEEKYSQRTTISARKHTKGKDKKNDDRRQSVRAGSFRGGIRPNLLETEHSPTEEDPESWLNKPFEVYNADISEDFPAYLTDEISTYFQNNPLPDVDESKEGKHRHSSKHHSSKHHSGKHHSSKHHSSKHHSSKHHSSKHHSSKHHSSKHHSSKHDKNDEENVQTRSIDLANGKESLERKISKKTTTITRPRTALDDLLDQIPILEPISPPKNMFLYVDHYGRPRKEPLRMNDGTSLSNYDPPPIDLINVVPPKLSQNVSVKTKTKPVRRWPDQASIDLSSMEKDNGEFVAFNFDELKFDEFPDVDTEDEDSDDEDIEIPQFLTIKREREETGKNMYNLEKEYPVFPILPEPYKPEFKAKPQNWEFQLTHVKKIGNFNLIKNLKKQSLDEIVCGIDEDIQKDAAD